MTAHDDLFPELLPAPDGHEAIALAWGLVCDWFGTLSYRHSESIHREILDSLDEFGMRDFVKDAALFVHGQAFNFNVFADGIRQQARQARAAGLVVPDGKPRVRKSAALAMSDLLGMNESGVAA